MRERIYRYVLSYPFGWSPGDPTGSTFRPPALDRLSHCTPRRTRFDQLNLSVASTPQGSVRSYLGRVITLTVRASIPQVSPASTPQGFICNPGSAKKRHTERMLQATKVSL